MDNVLQHLKDDFYNNTKFKKTGDEDNVKLGTVSNILSPLFEMYTNQNILYDSEHTYYHGGRSDGTIGTLVFEYKDSGYFGKDSGIREALCGRRHTSKNDSGLYQYIIDSISSKDNKINDTIFETNGIGFDGRHWIFSRFVPDNNLNEIDVKKTKFDDGGKHFYNARFVYHIKSFSEGIKELTTLIKSMDTMKLSKDNLTSVFRPQSKEVKESILGLYDVIIKETNEQNPTFFNKRVNTLYVEWLRNFGTMFGEENENSEFNETTKNIAELYQLESNNIDPKAFLFALQTYFNIVLKLLISKFLSQVKSPLAFYPTRMGYSDIISLFEGKSDDNGQTIINNFFELHYYEWFTFVLNDNDAKKDDTNKIVSIVNNVLEDLDQFDIGTFIVRPESVHDILQEVYMNLIPDKVRHLLGEYFSPDWMAEFALNRLGYNYNELGNSLIDKKIIDPTCGSGAFLLQALKRTASSNISNNKRYLTQDEIQKITSNVVGFDLNPISAIAAKANYILTLIPFVDVSKINKSLTIPIFITDSVLSPVVYSEENKSTVVVNTSIDNFIIPKFDTFNNANDFMNDLSKYIKRCINFNVFWNIVKPRYNIKDSMKNIVSILYEKLMKLNRSQQDSFWPGILKNSFAPVLLKQKFDFVVGNPPWIAWKAMSKTYRKGTLKVWQSYGIFEKNAYDKKTTHDDFGMAVTYVALDQYLRNNGKLFFLLPKTFIKSAKGGQGFRKFKITRKDQNIPIKVLEVNDFNDIKIFLPKHTIPTIAMLMKKGEENKFPSPMNKWFSWHYKDKMKIRFGAHDNWNYVKNKIYNVNLSAAPVNAKDNQSAWLTLPKKEFSLANIILSNGNKQNYKGRKGIEPAGAKGVYIIKKPKVNKLNSQHLDIINDMSRQRRKDIKDKGAHSGTIESKYVFPMLGGRNIQRWKITSSEYMIIPHDKNHVYGLSEEELSNNAPLTYDWLSFYKKELSATRIQNGKYFNPKTNPWYRLDNVGKYTYSPYKVLWKEQAKSFSAVAVGSYLQSIPNADLSLLGGIDKPIVNDSKVLSISTNDFNEALFITGVLNSPTVRYIIDSYAVNLNRGIDVVKYINVPKFDFNNKNHINISNIAKDIQDNINKLSDDSLHYKESNLDKCVNKLFRK